MPEWIVLGGSVPGDRLPSGPFRPLWAPHFAQIGAPGQCDVGRPSFPTMRIPFALERYKGILPRCVGTNWETDNMFRSRQRRHRYRSSDPTPPAPEDDTSAPVDAAEAWKAVGLVNDWVRHAETKAAATLATAGVIGGVLYNLVKNQTEFSLTIKIFGPTSGGLAFGAAIASVIALWPRLRPSDDPTSLLYFDHIARKYPKDHQGPEYVSALKALVSDPDRLLEQLGQQVWANARVARRKFRWAGWAMVGLIGSALALAVVSVRLALLSMGVWDG